jgi:L1 cell adhesion molecule like protein
VWRPWQANHGEVVINDQGSLLMPSCDTFTSVDRFVGDAAMNQAALTRQHHLR